MCWTIMYRYILCKPCMSSKVRVGHAGTQDFFLVAHAGTSLKKPRWRGNQMSTVWSKFWIFWKKAKVLTMPFNELSNKYPFYIITLALPQFNNYLFIDRAKYYLKQAMYFDQEWRCHTRGVICFVVQVNLFLHSK